MLAADALSKRYPNGVHALQGLSLVLAPGEVLAIVGGSGCGKSTLLRLLAGLETPTSGSVEIDAEPIAGPHPKVGFVFQEPRLLPWLTVAQNVAFGLGDLDRAARDRRVADILARVGLADKARVWPRELSGGQAQRVAIARALVARPEALLLDEPFSALDAFMRVDLQRHLLDVWAATEPRPTLVIVTHDVDEAVTVSDRILVMRPKPGRALAVVDNPAPRPRDRRAPEFDAVRLALLEALERSFATEGSASVRRAQDAAAR